MDGSNIPMGGSRRQKISSNTFAGLLKASLMKQKEKVRVWLNASECELHDDPNDLRGFAFPETTNEMVITAANALTTR